MFSMKQKSRREPALLFFYWHGFTATFYILMAQNRIFYGAVLANSRRVIIR